MTPKKPQYSPQKHRPIDYGATQQLVQPTNKSLLLNEKGIKRIQGIVGALLYWIFDMAYPNLGFWQTNSSD